MPITRGLERRQTISQTAALIYPRDVNINGCVIEVQWSIGDRSPALRTVSRTGSRIETRDGHGCTLYVTHSTLRERDCRSQGQGQHPPAGGTLPNS